MKKVNKKKKLFFLFRELKKIIAFNKKFAYKSYYKKKLLERKKHYSKLLDDINLKLIEKSIILKE
jgi:hypothetical protein